MAHGIDSRPINTEASTGADDFVESAADLHEDAPVYFLHIPRTGGSSVMNTLDAFYAPGEIIPSRLGWPEFAADPELLRQYALFQGSFTCNLRKVVKQRLRYITLLRDPVERALSHYAAVMSDESHYLHSRARQLKNFEGYLSDPETRPTVTNFQLRAIAFDLDPIDLSSGVGSSDDHALKRILDTRPFDLSERQLLERAKERLHRFCLVGITERFDESIRLMCELFEWPVPDLAGGGNKKACSHREQIDPLLLKQLQEANQADIELYAYACAVFEDALRHAKLTRPAFGAFVSYASNQEDVILHRVFSEVVNGSYIDVGAQDPVGDSLTKALYDRGWRGINIEPVERYYRSLQQDRPDEINIQAVVGASPGTVTFYEVDDTGLSTVSKLAAEHYAAQGFRVRPQSVAVRTLTEICDSYAVHEPHFLKIDAEGAEADILHGLDLERIRPWLVVIEATVPNLPEPNFSQWEPLILDHRYECVYKDGLNRFYLAAERSALRARFEHPPNVFDRFVRISEVLSREQFRSANVHYRISLCEIQRMRKHANLEADAFAVERKEALKQITALTNSFATTEAYAKSLERDRNQLRDEVVKQVAALTASMAAAEAYAKSLEQDRERLHAEFANQVKSLEVSRETAEIYAKSLEGQLERARQEGSSHTLELERLTSRLEKTTRELDAYRNHWIFRVLGDPSKPIR